MSSANVQQSVRQVEKMRDDMIDLKSKLSARLRQTSEQDNASPSHLTAVTLQLRSPDEKKADVVEELIKLKLNILDVKMSRTNDILSELRSLQPRDLPPRHLTVNGYENWVQSNEAIYKLQSRLLAVQSQLRRLEHVNDQRESTETDSATQSVTIDHHFSVRRQKRQLYDGDLIINRSLRLRADSRLSDIRSHLRTFLGHHRHGELNSIDDEDFAGAQVQKFFLDDLFSLNESNASFEGRKLREYVAECWKEDTVLELSGRHPMGAHPSRYQEYTQALCDYVIDYQSTHHGKELAFSTVHSKVESSLMPAIRTCCLQHVQARADDKTISEQCDKFRCVAQSQMGIPERFQSKEIVPFADAIATLKASYFSVTPGRKLYHIVSAAHAVFNKVAEVNDEAAGADIFIDIWCYVVIKANVSDLATTCAYISEYCNPSLIQGEAGYFLSSLQLASQYIMTLADDKLEKSERLEQFVTCDIPGYQRLCAVKDSPFLLYGACQNISGYKAYLIKDWYFNSARLWRSVLVPSDQESVIRVAVVKVKPGLLRSQEDYIRDMIQATGFQMLHTPLGPTAGLQNISDSPQGLTLVSMSNGAPDEWTLIDTCLILERLAVPLPAIAFNEHLQRHRFVVLTGSILQRMDEQFRGAFGTPSGVSLSLVIPPSIKVCQVMLQHLGYLTTLLAVDGLYSDLVLDAVRRFQVCHNRAVDDGSAQGSRVPEEGHLTKSTYEALHLTLQHIRLRMERLGLVCNIDPCSADSADAFRHFITECQKAWGLTPPVFGTLNRVTRGEIDRQLRLLNPNSSWI